MTAVMKAGASNRGCSSIWEGLVRDKRGRVKHRGRPHSNLRVNSGNDWQGLSMSGGQAASIFATATGSATATSSTTLTNSGASFPTSAVTTGATGGLAGQIVCAASDAGSNVYGVIISNTATVLTVDRWVTAASPYAAATTPAATCKYQVIQAWAPAWYLGLSSTVQSGAAGDTVLAGELTTSGFSRIQATTITHTLAASSYSLAKTFTASGTATINSEAVFVATGAAGVGAAATSGVMVFENAEPNAPTLVSGDTLAQTVTVNY